MISPVAAMARALLGQGERSGGTADAADLLSLSGAAFREAMLAAVRDRDAAEAPLPGEAGAAAVGADGAPAAAAPSPPAPSSDLPDAPTGSRSPGVSAREAAVIDREAARAGVDPALLVALRRTENGGPGREFGVCSLAAPGLESQARVAANSVRNGVARFAAQGGQPINPASGTYTPAFLRFFSARYAPVGAPNDPGGLNRNHAANLIALYERAKRGQACG